MFHPSALVLFSQPDCLPRLVGSAQAASELLLCVAWILPPNRSSPADRVPLTTSFFSPCRDAAWELEPGAFSELYQRYQHCDAPICLYEQGRDSFEDEG